MDPKDIPGLIIYLSFILMVQEIFGRNGLLIILAHTFTQRELLPFQRYTASYQ